MDIFNSNRKLEEIVLYALDWGVFLRRDLESPVAPFIYINSGDRRLVRKLMADGNPLEFAKKVLEQEKEPIDQYVVGIEGYLRDQNDKRVDAIIVQGFDITENKGVSLGQMFLPKENGGFEKIDKVNFLGNPDPLIPKQARIDVNKHSDDVGFNAIAADKDGLTKYIAVFSHENPSLIANTIKQFLRSKITGDQRHLLEGSFKLEIPPAKSMFEDFLRFLVTNAIEEELTEPHSKEWEHKFRRKLRVECRYDEKEIYSNMYDDSARQKEPAQQNEQDKKKEALEKYSSFSDAELDQEFSRIASIPNARTNIPALESMSELLKEYKKRGIVLPTERKTQTKSGRKGCGTAVLLIIIATVVTYLLI